MKLESVDVIPFPRELVYRTLRDELTRLVPYLPNIEEIQVERRVDLGNGLVEILNRWKARSDLPKVVQAFLTPDQLTWLDHATWIEPEWACDWRLETAFFTESVSCSGRNVYRALDGDRTELTIRGELAVDARRIAGVPRLVAGTVGAAVERFVVALITPNFKRLDQGLASYLEERSRQP